MSNDLKELKLKKAFYEYCHEENYLDATKEGVLGKREEVQENVQNLLDELNLRTITPKEMDEAVYRGVFDLFSIVEKESYQTGATHYLSFFGAQRYHKFQHNEEADQDVKEKFPGNAIDDNILKLRDLLYADEGQELKEAYNQYCSINHIGHNNPSAFLMYTKPDKYVMVNGKTRNALENLGVNVHLTEHRYEEYKKALDTARRIFDILRESNIDKEDELQDYIQLDWFFHNVGANNIPQDEKNVWLEKTRKNSHSEQNGWDFGECLASPQADSRGGDIYSNMRECVPGDLVLHYLQDKQNIVGITTVDDVYEEIDHLPSDMGDRWAEKPGYRVPLGDYSQIKPPLDVDLVLDRKYQDQLVKAHDNRGNHQIFYNQNFSPRQGAYLTGVPPKLQEVFNLAYRREHEEFLHGSLKTPEMSDEPPTETYSPETELAKRNSSELIFEGLDITEGLYFPSSMEEQINESVRSALKSGKHIIFTGPPGTGKTKVAKNTAEFIRNNNESVDDYIFTTATADWTTFDTIGGYHPSKDEDTLEFKPGQFLKCFREDDGRPINKWLIIDEINRADIDKAFGQLFSVLSNDNVELPFTAENDDGKAGTIQIVSLDKEEDFDYSESSYYVTSNWRLLATMNTYDKSSLYEMSYAFMRRFAFIDVGVPTGEIDPDLIKNYITEWDDLTVSDVSEHLNEVATMWKVLNEGKRSIGPAIIKDILSFLKENEGDNGLVNALKLYVLPQLEGMVNQNQKAVLANLVDKIGYEQEIEKVAKQRFEIELSTENE